MKQQTFIVYLEDQDGRMIDFERWCYKRSKTCLDAMVKLYGSWPSLYLPQLAKAARVVCYPTPDGSNKEAPAWSLSAEEFRERMKEGAA